MPSSEVPTVSIVTATYHRPEGMALAIRSVLRQTVQDWEMLVVGDCCTDHTAETVAAFHDARIRFINLPLNCGEQSGPNNEGIRQARGTYVAFLNHDDLWFPEHLKRLLALAEDTSADFVAAPGLAVTLDGGLRLVGVGEGQRYEPNIFVGASSWLVRRELFARVGVMRNFRDCFLVPTQDWLFRAWRSGACMWMLEDVSWLAIMSGLRKGSYTEKGGAEEHAFWHDRMLSEPGLREDAVAKLMPPMRAKIDAHPLRHPYRALRRVGNRLLFRVGLSSMLLRNILRHGGRGGYIKRLRKVRGLPQK